VRGGGSASSEAGGLCEPSAGGEKGVLAKKKGNRNAARVKGGKKNCPWWEKNHSDSSRSVKKKKVDEQCGSEEGAPRYRGEKGNFALNCLFEKRGGESGAKGPSACHRSTMILEANKRKKR